MPLRSEVLRKRWSAADLPVLPFLAPRVFSPWPWRHRRLHSATRPDGSKPELTAQENTRCLQNNRFGGLSSAETPTPLEWSRKRVIGDGDSTSESTSKYTNETGDNLPEEFADSLFMRKYEEIWGSSESTDNLGNEQKAAAMLVQAGVSEREDIERHPTKTIRNGSDINGTEATKCTTGDSEALLPSYHAHSWSRQRPPAGEGRSWHEAFARVNSYHPKYNADKSLSTHVVIEEEPIFPQFVKRYLITTDPSTLLEKWMSLSQEARVKLWPELMMEALQYHPAEAFRVLVATYSDLHAPAYAVTDSLGFIVSHHLKTAGAGKAHVASSLQETITSFLTQYPTDHLYLSQNTMYELLSNIDDETLERYYENLAKTGQVLRNYTLMHFLSRFSKSGKTDLGFEILEELGSRGVDFSSTQMMSLCSTLLHAQIQEQSDHDTMSQRFQFMLSHGMRPNTITYNILIQNSLQAGDIKTGWQIHNLMVESAVAPDAYTYSILLNDAKKRMDVPAIRTVMSFLKDGSIKSPYLVTDVLDSIMLLHRREESRLARDIDSTQAPETAFKRMLDVYWEHYSLDPLHRLIPDLKIRYPSTHSTDFDDVPHSSFADPPRHTLIIMLAGYLRELGSTATLDLFQHFHRLVRSGDQISISLSSTTHIWNTFLLALGKFPDRVFDCAKVLGMMIATNPIPITSKVTPSPITAGADQIEQIYDDESSTLEDLTGLSAIDLDATQEVMGKAEREMNIPEFQELDQLPTSLEEDGSQTRVLPRISQNSQPLKERGGVQPDIYTWTILLKIFTEHQLLRAAEKVLSAMQQRNITPNLITWNTLAYGYSRSQNANMAADALNRMVEAGLTPDETTRKAISGIRDRRKLIQALNDKDAERRRLQTDDSFVGKRFVKSLKKEMMEDRPGETTSIDRNWG